MSIWCITLSILAGVDSANPWKVWRSQIIQVQCVTQTTAISTPQTDSHQEFDQWIYSQNMIRDDRSKILSHLNIVHLVLLVAYYSPTTIFYQFMLYTHLFAANQVSWNQLDPDRTMDRTIETPWNSGYQLPTTFVACSSLKVSLSTLINMEMILKVIFLLSPFHFAVSYLLLFCLSLCFCTLNHRFLLFSASILNASHSWTNDCLSVQVNYLNLNSSFWNKHLPNKHFLQIID